MGRLLGSIREWAGRRLRTLTLGWLALAWLASVVRRSRAAAKDVPLSPVRAGRFVGVDFLERRGLVDSDAPAPSGELDDLADFDGDAFEADGVQRSVRRFYEETADYEMDYRVTWLRGFRVGAALAGRLTSRIEQLNLPNWGSDWRPLESRFVAVDVPGDPREEVRGWVRTTTERGAGSATGGGDATAREVEDAAVTDAAVADAAVADAAAADAAVADGDGGSPDPDREAVFVALYGAYDADGERLVNIAVPLPGGNLSTVLRPRTVDDGIEWTTAGDGGPGLYLVTPLGPFRLPLSQRFVVWDENEERGDGDGESPAPAPDLRARHEMEVFGRRFLTVDYRMQRTAATRGD